ncbi:Protein STR-33, partial [Aphelenchoides avenae]
MSVSFEWTEGTENHRLNVKKGSLQHKVLMSVIGTMAQSSNRAETITGGVAPEDQELANLHRTSAELLHDLALMLNLLLIYLIIKHSRFQTSAYKYILGLACVMDIVLAVAAVLSRPVCFVSGGFMLLISEGIGSTNATVAFYTMLFWVSALHANIIGVAVQFAWRYKVVCSRTASLSASSKLLLWVFPVAYSIFGAFVIGRTMTPTADYPATAEHILRELPWARPD